MKYLMSLSEEK